MRLSLNQAQNNSLSKDTKYPKNKNNTIVLCVIARSFSYFIHAKNYMNINMKIDHNIIDIKLKEKIFKVHYYGKSITLA